MIIGRYERDNFDGIFADLAIRRLDCDDTTHGFFLLARRPEGFTEAYFRSHRLFSILSGKRELELQNWQIKFFSAGRRLGDVIYPYLGAMECGYRL